MTAYTWIGGSGNWDLAGNWRPGSPAGPPKATDTATISETGPGYTVEIGSPDVAASLTESSASAIVNDIGGGSLTLTGTFTLSAGTFNLGSNGTLSGGTTKLTGGTFVCDGGTLSGVTFDGTLDLSDSFATIYLARGTVVNNAAGTGAGTINVTGGSSSLNFDNTQTFNNATINLGAGQGGSSLSENDLTGAGTVLTLGPGVTIDESGEALIDTGGDAGDGIVNQGKINQTASGGALDIVDNSFTNSGTITAGSSGGALTIDTSTFTNNGAIDISNGETVTIDPTTFTNLSATTLTGGAYTVGAGSVLELADNAKIVTDDANITLSGKGSLIQSLNTTTDAQQSFDSTLRTVGAAGKLNLLADRSLTTAAAAIADNGLIQLGSGTLKVTGTGSSLTIGAAGKLEGFGVVDATTLTNSGLIEASGGTLTVDNAIKGSGSLEISAEATLILDGSAASGAFTQGAGSTTAIATGDSLSLTGTASLSGTTSGSGGTLALAGGSATIESGATVTASIWSISGAGADVTLGENLNYAGSFSEAAGDTFVLSGGNLLLSGADTFSGGTVDGSKLLETEGKTTVSGLTIGGTVEWENTKTVIESSGPVTIGNSSGDKAFLDNTSTGTYDISGAGGIGRGSSTASYIDNAGTLRKDRRDGRERDRAVRDQRRKT